MCLYVYAFVYLCVFVYMCVLVCVHMFVCAYVFVWFCVFIVSWRVGLFALLPCFIFLFCLRQCLAV